jgi:sugar/nucleoside kinase (ribokinase family)
MAALLVGLLVRDFKPPDEAALSELGRHACAAGAVMAGAAGAMEQMPRREDIAALLDYADRRVAEQAELFAFPNGAS